MGQGLLRRAVSCGLLLVVPGSLAASEPNAAILYPGGVAWVNGAYVHQSSAIFVGDMIQTRRDSVASIDASGATVTVAGDSLVRFNGESLNLEHGGIAISTSKEVAAIAGAVRVVPASIGWTEFEVSDVDGTVHIAARKGSLSVTDGSGTVALAQGQETTRDDSADQSGKDQSGKEKKRNSKKRGIGANPAAEGGLLNSTYAMAAGGVAVGGLAVWVLTRHEDAVSPSKP